jgi:hypothetical protein
MMGIRVRIPVINLFYKVKIFQGTLQNLLNPKSLYSTFPKNVLKCSKWGIYKRNETVFKSLHDLQFGKEIGYNPVPTDGEEGTNLPTA